MFKKIILFVFALLFFMLQEGYALENIPLKPEIIPRSSWGANELYTDLNSSYWKQILENRKNAVDTRTPEEKKRQEENYKKSIQYINDNFALENTVTHKVEYDLDTGYQYAWPLSYTDYVNAIIIHHTHSEPESSEIGIQQIYKYHALNRGWGDIGYNYIIGYEGQIFEGRKGGEYVAGAHSRWNNYSTVGISIIGDYHDTGISEKQYESLESLVRYLTWYYGIDLSKQHYYHMDCAGDKCDTFPLETYLDDTLAGHRDTGHTSCPGDALYAQMQKLRTDNLEFTQGFEPKKRPNGEEYTSLISSLSTSIITQYSKIIQGYGEEELKLIKGKIDSLLLDSTIESDRRKKLQILRLAIILHIKD